MYWALCVRDFGLKWKTNDSFKIFDKIGIDKLETTWTKRIEDWK